MKRKIVVFALLSCAMVYAQAQTATKPHTATAAAAKPKTATTAASTATTDPKLPASIPAIKAKWNNYTPEPIRYEYQDEVVGTGEAVAQGKLLWLHYTGYIAADGVKFDSSHDHPESAVYGKDGKPALDADGKPKKEPGQPLIYMMGSHKWIPGMEAGVVGMKAGGKRRVYIPWLLGYGEAGVKSPDAKKNPDIPAKADLVFDIELLDVTEAPARPQPRQPGQGGMPGRPQIPGQPGARPNIPPPAANGAAAPAATPVATPAATPATTTPATAPTTAPKQ